jgi:RND family efflux transporter MFP subunit
MIEAVNGPQPYDPARPAPVKAGRGLLILAAIAAAVAAYGVVQRRSDEGQLARWTQQQAIPAVSLISPGRETGAREVVLPGNVEAYFDASIHGQVSGYVREWRTDIGAQVHKGDVLAVIDTPELDERISAAQGELEKANANLALAKVTADRWSELRTASAVSQQASDEKQSDFTAKTAELNAEQANVDRLKALKAFSNIVAPFDGVVTARNVDVGSLVRDGSSPAPLFSVADVHKMRIYVRAPEPYAAEMKEGVKATFELPEYPNRKFEAKIDTTSRAFDKKSRTLLIELIADNPHGLLSPGAFARVHFEIAGDTNVMTLPANALLFREDGASVATVGADGRVALKKVEISRDFGNDMEIAGGLDAEARVIANPPDSLAEGERVRVVPGKNDSEADSSGGGQVRAAAADSSPDRGASK